MSMRGRGTLEVKPCDNPFFQTTNANIGAVAGQRQWVAPESYKPKKLQKDTRYDFNFMYRKESDQYGKGIGYSDSALSATVRNTESKGEVARKKGEGLYPMAPPAPAAEPAEPVTKLNRPLPNYQTNTKQEHPMYATTNNQFGFKNPDRSTMTVDRVFIPQEFSNSFNNIKYRDQGLNTALAKSKIHTQLDPHFL